jgi:xylan 1,4-beta-xylosidase
MRPLFLLLAATWVLVIRGDAAHLIEIDFGQTNGFFRPLHSINKGGFAAGGTINLTEQLRPLNIPFARLHDCQWPFPDVVDVHAIFPDVNRDPADALAYDFALTDEYLRSVFAAGMQVVYRLGESIEHTDTKRFVHPPKDPEHWAKICLGIIKHYNEGWAKGHHYGIRYWEIWNEPENRPAMWSGTDDDYLALYATAALRIKRAFPGLSVGGPGVGYSGSYRDGVFQPSAFITNFLARCRRDSLPLDFFSWHCYTHDPSELSDRARAIRELLDRNGFKKTESHLNEWNYLPGGSWHGAARRASPLEREEFYRTMSGDAGAAFILAALIELQNAPVDMCNLFHGELGAFGLFNEFGVPYPNYYALKAFAGIAGRLRASVRGSVPGQLAAAASDGCIVVSNFKLASGEIVLRVGGLAAETCEVQINSGKAVDHKFVDGELRLRLPRPAIAFIRLRPDKH